MKPDLIKVKRRGNREYYFFHLSPDLKERLRKDGLFWYFNPSFYHFWTLEDPAFYKDGEIVGEVTSCHNIIRINAKFKKDLEKRGLDFSFAT